MIRAWLTRRGVARWWEVRGLDQASYKALYQRLNHEPQTSRKQLKKKEFRRQNLF